MTDLDLNQPINWDGVEEYEGEVEDLSYDLEWDTDEEREGEDAAAGRSSPRIELAGHGNEVLNVAGRGSPPLELAGHGDGLGLTGRANGVDDVAGRGSPRLEHAGHGDGRLEHAGRGGDHQAEQHLGEPHSGRGNEIHGARLELNGSRSFSPGSSSGTLERAGSVSLHEAPTPGACGHTPF